MRASISLDLLPVFVSVARHRSFTRAARELGLRRSAVSRRVAALEEELGVELLVRSTRRVDLTTAGRGLLDRIEAPLAELRDALVELPDRSGAPAGPLRLTAPADLGLRILPPVLGALTRAHPEVIPDVELTNRVVDLEAEGFDAALRVSMSTLPDSALRARMLGPIHTRLYGAADYLARRGAPVSREDLADHELVRIAGPLPVGTTRATTVSATDMLMALRLVEEGMGLALLPTFLAADSVAHGALVPVLPDVGFGTGTLYVVFPSTRRLPARSIAFRDALLAWLQEHPLPDLR